MQKRGWTGIWARHSDANATKLVLGWDLLYLNVKIPFAMPINYTSFPSKIVGKELLKFSNYSLSTAGVTDASIPFLNISQDNYNDLEKRMNKMVSTGLGKLAELVWKETESFLASASLDVKNEKVKSYRKIFPDKIKVMLSKAEDERLNSNNMNFVIDRYFQITYNATGNAQFNSLYQNILGPTFKTSKKLYEIEGASVYGAAVFGGQTKGIRIIKEID
ncbi:MAG: hypothetical protein EA341_01240 [Mongoliibacter sp.]|uniref:hypothetical protein n=1 Tax=Mongoliibacter sp. TaxID=2022438 RepID=UPI0012EFAA16|nr:hypothetical protein [Mongoliibacter sp.]TVP53274.1 MAG: hypothetical protein EA341_01240 [Mongoliibacter sp.]